MAISNTLTYEKIAKAIKIQDELIQSYTKIHLPIIKNVLPEYMIGNPPTSNDYSMAAEYLEFLQFSNKDKLTIKKKWDHSLFTKKLRCTLEISLNDEKYTFLTKSEDFYRTHQFTIMDKNYNGNIKMISMVSASSETLQKMAYKYSQLVEYIENRYDLTLEDLIMRF